MNRTNLSRLFVLLLMASMIFLSCTKQAVGVLEMPEGMAQPGLIGYTLYIDDDLTGGHSLEYMRLEYCYDDPTIVLAPDFAGLQRRPQYFDFCINGEDALLEAEDDDYYYRKGPQITLIGPREQTQHMVVSSLAPSKSYYLAHIAYDYIAGYKYTGYIPLPASINPASPELKPVAGQIVYAGIIGILEEETDRGVRGRIVTGEEAIKHSTLFRRRIFYTYEPTEENAYRYFLERFIQQPGISDYWKDQAKQELNAMGL